MIVSKNPAEQRARLAAVALDERIAAAVEDAPPLPDDLNALLRTLIRTSPEYLAEQAARTEDDRAAAYAAERRSEEEKVRADVRRRLDRKQAAMDRALAEALADQIEAMRAARPAPDPTAELAHRLQRESRSRGYEMPWLDAYDNAHAIVEYRRIGFLGDRL